MQASGASPPPLRPPPLLQPPCHTRHRLGPQPITRRAGAERAAGGGRAFDCRHAQASNLDRPGPPPAPGFLALRPRSGVPARTAARRRPRSALNLSSVCDVGCDTWDFPAKCASRRTRRHLASGPSPTAEAQRVHPARGL
ncbi:triple functional domain [Micractinium conductrix]|uniref:Triple functional domain n=1 Tax=Micractinium conductrix TaxID=554055 RepID=A0A2P6VMJ6_9CHLO|nr:triple functional domain [Micractinium conductrix]|eukprot:PSC75265.1 triple functional domain [Micractinium conductrix]